VLAAFCRFQLSDRYKSEFEQPTRITISPH